MRAHSQKFSYAQRYIIYIMYNLMYIMFNPHRDRPCGHQVRIVWSIEQVPQRRAGRGLRQGRYRAGHQNQQDKEIDHYTLIHSLTRGMRYLFRVYSGSIWNSCMFSITRVGNSFSFITFSTYRYFITGIRILCLYFIVLNPENNSLDVSVCVCNYVYSTGLLSSQWLMLMCRAYEINSVFMTNPHLRDEYC